MTKIDPAKQPKVRIKGNEGEHEVQSIDYQVGVLYVDIDDSEYVAEITFDDIEEFVTDEPDKVSDCCGAEVELGDVFGDGKDFDCKSCGEPCEAVEENFLEWRKGKKLEEVNDTKPDPIEPLDMDKIASGKGWNEYHQKINEQSEVINYLLEQHD